MKKLVLLFFSVLLIFNFLGCSKKEDEVKLIKKTMKLYENKKYEEALKSSKKLCELNHPFFCYLSATIIKGTGGKIEEANKFYKYGCETKIKKMDGNGSKEIYKLDEIGKNTSCYNYALNLYEKKNVLKSNDILVDLCENKKYIPACETLVSIAFNDQDDKKAAVKYIRKTLEIYNNLNDKEKEEYRSDIAKLKTAGMQLCVFGTALEKIMSGNKDMNMSEDCNYILNKFLKNKKN